MISIADVLIVRKAHTHDIERMRTLLNEIIRV